VWAGMSSHRTALHVVNGTVPSPPCCIVLPPFCISPDQKSYLVNLVTVIQRGLLFELQDFAYSMDGSKVVYILSYLSDRAEAWAMPEWNRKSTICKSLELLSKILTKNFQHTAPGREAARTLVNLHQRNRRVCDYAIDFRTLAADSGWDDLVLFDAFLK